MSIKRVQKKPKLIRLPEGYGPILRPTARETYSLRQQIFELVRATGRIARAKIARTLDISPGSVTALTAELISDGFLREVEETSRETTRGRPPVALELVPDALYVIGVKLSDELHTATLTDFGGNALASASQITTADKKSADELLTETEAIISKVCKSAKISQKKISAIGVGISGIVNYETGVVAWSPLLEELDTPLGDIFSTYFKTPVCIDNDANVLTLAELWFGAGRALSNFAVITIEHGVGMGFVSDNRLFRGAHSMGLELGHSKVQLDGALCRCGQRGCLEAYLADYALAREASTALITPSSKRQDLNDYLKSLYEMAKLGDQASLKIFKRAGRYLAVALSNIIHLFDPKLIILSGKPMQYEFLYDEEMQIEMRSLALYKSRFDTQIEIQSWGSMVWARGATALALTELTKTIIVEGH
ncbi:ROK family protein [bacterium]|nr:ROK family protein [bacterium]MDB4839283.1 ROK family protein [Amylibacter sp.]MDC0087429.1 ROK family protein [Amylibacter sp.]MDC0121168.1 ROK family protein [Amylibacter sp.]